MVTGSRIEGGNGTQNLSAGVRRTIQSIKEIVGNHSDADIYVALKETNMDPNETAQKLLNQDPFHEVKRKRDKKKEVTPIKEPVPIKPRKPTEQLVQGIKPNTYSDRIPFRRAGFVRNNVSDAGRTRQFRVIRDNRMNQNETRERKPFTKSSVVVTTKEPLTSTSSDKNSSEASKTIKSPPFDSLSKQVKGGVSSTAIGRRPLVSKVSPPVQVAIKPHDSVTSPNSSVVGVYSSSSDPVHIPSLASRPAANVGAIKREIGPVGGRRHATSENPAKLASPPVSNTKDHFRSFPGVSKTDHSNVAEPVPSGSRSFNNHYSSRPHQQLVTHQKVSQANKEWKPKPSQKPSVTEVGVIGTPKKSTSSPAKKSKDLSTDSSQPQEKLLKNEDQNVIIASHIRVSETDRMRLTFGSLGIDSDLLPPQTCGHIDKSPSLSTPESSIEETSGSGSKQVDEQSSSEPQSTDRVESCSQNMENYTNIGLVSEQKGPSELPSFSETAYDPQTGYDMSYFRPASDESLRAQVLQVSHEGGFSSHVANSILPATTTTIPTVQQQQQMYPQVHLSPHFAAAANLMPYRQFLSPVYVPPMVMPGPPTYSPHLMMAGASSPHVTAKYAIPQYKTGYAPGLDDSSRLKYKDANVYVPNPQAETSELWRDVQSGSYYNMAGQSTYHTGHAAAQSSHMQFPGLYHHPPQPAHHMGGAGPQPGYQQQQQPQLSQLSWTGNF